uniref:fimbria/pilus periplasmic chaperone n=1 Tax=Entomohabitans teleogrylli TaxID=1384589 RepID=UPI000AE7837D
GSEKSIALNITNDSTTMPYLAQGWIEDEQGKKISSPLVVVPPLQRLEPQGKSMIRINALPDAASLPQDRETVFYFSVREVPPKSDRPNVMQLALHTKIKLFYR